jgi:hypothetical protein
MGFCLLLNFTRPLPLQIRARRCSRAFHSQLVRPMAFNSVGRLLHLDAHRLASPAWATTDALQGRPLSLNAFLISTLVFGSAASRGIQYSPEPPFDCSHFSDTAGLIASPPNACHRSTSFCNRCRRLVISPISASRRVCCAPSQNCTATEPSR